MQAVTMTVEFTVQVPVGTNPDSLCLNINYDGIEVQTDDGDVVEGAAIQEHKTVQVVEVELVEDEGESEDVE